MTGITMAIGKKLPLYLRKPTFPDQRWYHLSADGKRSYGDKLRATRPPSRAGCSVYKKNKKVFTDIPLKLRRLLSVFGVFGVLLIILSDPLLTGGLPSLLIGGLPSLLRTLADLLRRRHGKGRGLPIGGRMLSDDLLLRTSSKFGRI